MKKIITGLLVGAITAQMALALTAPTGPKVTREYNCINAGHEKKNIQYFKRDVPAGIVFATFLVRDNATDSSYETIHINNPLMAAIFDGLIKDKKENGQYTLPIPGNLFNCEKVKELISISNNQ